MKINEKKEKSYKIYVPELKGLIPVSKEVYQNYYKPIWKHQKAMQKQEKCFCTQGNHWKCDGCYLDCKYYSRGDWSLDYGFEILGDIRNSGAPNLDEIISDSMFIELLLKRLSELMPEAIEIGHLKLEGLSEREIEKKIGIPRKTFKYRLDKAKKLLISEFGEEIKKYF